ncbi:hypothetical protein Tco_1311216 [Tanacetum coccineum]
MKEILHDWMFESGSYISHLDHTTLYEALEVSMERENRDEFNKAIAKSRKRRRDDQDPPPPRPKDSDRSKKKKHDFRCFPSTPPVILPNDLLETENNCADAMAKTYKDLEENKLLQKTGDMASFIQWYCK